MKRGALYRCARQNGYNVLALGQHADDIVESLLLSAFHNGALRTMKACYSVGGAGKEALRLIRPLAGVRESVLRDFAYGAGLPVIPDNCPACFEAPKERARVKLLLRREGRVFPHTLFSSLLSACQPLLDARVPHLLRATARRLEGRRNANKGKKGRAVDGAEEEVAADLGGDERLRGVESAALVAELERRGGLGMAAESLVEAEEEEEAAEEREEAAATGAGACPMPRRAA